MLHDHTLPTTSLFFYNDPATTQIYTLSLHDALPISSIEVELGRVVDGNVVLAETLAVLAERCAQLERGDSAQILSRWRELSRSCRGAAVEWDTASGPVSGITAGIDDDGALRVRVGQQ